MKREWASAGKKKEVQLLKIIIASLLSMLKRYIQEIASLKSSSAKCIKKSIFAPLSLKINLDPSWRKQATLLILGISVSMLSDTDSSSKTDISMVWNEEVVKVRIAS